MVTLPEFLTNAAETGFDWETANCLLFPADWYLSQRGIDLAAGFRGVCRTEPEFLRLVKREGGVDAIAARTAGRYGLVATDAPTAGDIGIVEGDFGATGAIRTEKGWAMLSPRGIIVGPRTKLFAWKL